MIIASFYILLECGLKLRYLAVLVPIASHRGVMCLHFVVTSRSYYVS